MTFGVSELVKKTVIEEMKAKGLESVTKYGFTFSTEQQDGTIPTREYTEGGKMIYIQPWETEGMADSPARKANHLGTPKYNELIEQLSTIRCLPGSSEPLAEGELRAWLVAAMRELPDTQKKVFHLHYCEGLTFAETAFVLNIPRDDAFRAHEQALETLRNLLKWQSAK